MFLFKSSALSYHPMVKIVPVHISRYKARNVIFIQMKNVEFDNAE
jgi:hypothetical protein